MRPEWFAHGLSIRRLTDGRHVAKVLHKEGVTPEPRVLRQYAQKLAAAPLLESTLRSVLFGLETGRETQELIATINECLRATYPTKERQ